MQAGCRELRHRPPARTRPPPPASLRGRSGLLPRRPTPYSHLWAGCSRRPYQDLGSTRRPSFGRGLLIGREVLVAADLIRTVAVQPTIMSVGVLEVIVVVRTLLSFALNVEIDGVLPWRKRALEATDAEQ
jgi:Protein of unknown function (DUF1622)